MSPWVMASSSRVLRVLEAAADVGDAARHLSAPDKSPPGAWLWAWVWVEMESMNNLFRQLLYFHIRGQMPFLPLCWGRKRMKTSPDNP